MTAATVRLLGPGDETLLEAAVRVFKNGGTGGGHHRFLVDPATITAVATDGEAVVGWAWGHRLRRPDGTSMIVLYEIEVVERCRRRGLGSRLVHAFLKAARGEEQLKMWVVTSHSNTAACRLYESTGATAQGGDDLVYSWDLG